MFTHLLDSNDELCAVSFTNYAKTHYLKKFEKNYKGKQWQYAQESIFEDLSRLGLKNNKTQFSEQIDELKHNSHYWLAKYDFRIAGTKQSTKAAGNRAVVFIDCERKIIKILLIYNKIDLPKNQSETDYIYRTIQKEYQNIIKNFSTNQQSCGWITQYLRVYLTLSSTK